MTSGETITESQAISHAAALAPQPWDHSQGAAEAPVTIIEYGDFECPYCGKAYPLLKRLREELGDQIRLIYRHFPLNSVHPHASVAAQAAEAAGAQGKFWEMHSMLFEHQDALENVDFDQYALRLGLEVYRFRADLSSERFSRRVQRDFESGTRLGVRKTPTLFVNAVKYDGPLEYEPLLKAVRAAAQS
jgi:protein-disulfide isomerase